MSDLETKKQGGLGYLLDLASSYYKSKVLFVSTDLVFFCPVTCKEGCANHSSRN